MGTGFFIEGCGTLVRCRTCAEEESDEDHRDDRNKKADR